ncbi:Dynein light chain [Cerrena zonata]|uniref:Dynein light chain n=1 Tax=Cerrena zonata TaxID=2478898 RepID=A0AAW0FDE0_9APHY
MSAIDNIPASSEELPILKASDLAEDIQTRILELSQEATHTYSVEKDIATFLKKELDQLYGPTWHVIVGKSFGSLIN